MKVTVIGSGYVGTTTALVLAELGHEVIGYDVDPAKVAKLNSGIVPFREPGLDDLLRKVLGRGNIDFTTDSRRAITESDLLMISVGTPSSPSGGADLTYLQQVIDAIATHIDASKTVVTKSTVPIGTNRWIQEELSRRLEGKPYQANVISNPEFLREGVALQDSLHPSRTVIGGENEAAIEAVKRLYDGLPTSYFICNYETAEMIKYASNGFLAAKISFINEMARLADRVGADIQAVSAGMGMDPRISPHHLYAGIGYGGSCFPKDVDELLYSAQQQEIELGILRQAKQVNASQIDWFVSKVEGQLPLQGKTLLVLGVAFKEDTDDQRESPGVRLIERLLEQGAEQIRVVDPTVRSVDDIRWTRQPNASLLERVSVYTDAEAAVAGVHAVLLATSWSQFSAYPWAEWSHKTQSALIFDGRNYLNAEAMKRAGWQYIGVARR
ncbi:UDP-glucose/GDP-mannose dehydrogenase family protein [Paenibacillus sp. GD4]|uniref:UDP-glucose dehydrogenase family protein n=1 Tax=Paenibacillus sp. GD4 TaxID=3068890 RepID=UPI002796DA2B|nr:UDP-glucose/GDP-mannose dehydrogenase family protein [Paenibacillus sp. GD4]MDQ1912286.1 UDP-glucose/GDP-mannose dehydrogenase family protein [Paenibacillus sp. GD4]